MRKWFALAAVLAVFSCPASAQGPASGTGYPAGATAFVATATGTTSATLTLTPPAGQRAWICGITASALAGTGQTAVGTITNIQGPTGAAVTISFLLQGSMAAASTTGFNEDMVPCAPSVIGQNVVVTAPTSTGATNTTLAVAGYFL